MSATGVRLPVGRVVALLGSTRARAAVVAQLDDASTRCADGHAHGGLVRVTGPLRGAGLLADVLADGAGVGRGEAALRTAVGFPSLAAHLEAPVDALGAEERAVAALALAALRDPVAVVVDRLPGARRALPALAAGGAAVLVDDADPVAVLAVADAALRVGDDGTVVLEDLALAA